MILTKQEIKNSKLKTIKDLQGYFIYYFQYSLQSKEFFVLGSKNPSKKVYDFLDSVSKKYSDTKFYQKKDLIKIWCLYYLETLKLDSSLKDRIHLQRSVDKILDNMDSLDTVYLESYINNVSLILNNEKYDTLIPRLKFDNIQLQLSPMSNLFLSLKDLFINIINQYSPLDKILNMDKLLLPIGKEEVLLYQPLDETLFEYCCNLGLNGVTEIDLYLFSQENPSSIKSIEEIKNPLEMINEEIQFSLNELITNKDLAFKLSEKIIKIVDEFAKDMIEDKK